MSAHPTERILGRKTFGPADQLWFAAASNDLNPMHVDAVAARRLISGRQVVHGIHTLLAALELWAAEPAPGHITVDCQFANPVNLGDTCVFAQVDDAPGRVDILVRVDGLVCTRVSIGSAGPRPGSPAPGTDRADVPATPIATLVAPLDEPAESSVGQRFTMVAIGAEQWASAFPLAARALGADRVACIAALSKFVGMVCPGLHSVFSSLAFSTVDPSGEIAGLQFDVRRYDPRFRLFVIAFDGCLRGEMRAFLRPPPQPQPSMQVVSSKVDRGEFGGTRSLVVGGSRGLGETTAKILAAGGGDVTVSHASGRDDALRVAGEINAAERGCCSTLKLDLDTTTFTDLTIDAGAFDAVYFFATPRIFRKKTEVFDRSVFDEFVRFYIERFMALCHWLEASPHARPVRVYLPSTVFVSERPKGMAEYAMAKAAAEVLADDLNRSLTRVRIVHSRLPRLATDQTAGILATAAGSSLEVLLAVVRGMNDARRATPNEKPAD